MRVRSRLESAQSAPSFRTNTARNMEERRVGLVSRREGRGAGEPKPRRMEEPPDTPPSGLAHRLRRAKLAAYPRRGAGDWTKEGHARSRLVEQLLRTVDNAS